MTQLRILFLTLVLTSLPAQARMYQWTDPDTGTTQLSGKPPAWYRSGEKGPRIIVFEKGRVIDDTSINISAAQREDLRREALIKAEEDREKARALALEAEQMKSRIDTVTAEEIPRIGEDQPVAEPTITAEPEPTAGVETQETEMRAVVSDWEKQRTEQAREKAGIDSDAVPATASPPLTGGD